MPWLVAGLTTGLSDLFVIYVTFKGLLHYPRSLTTKGYQDKDVDGWSCVCNKALDTDDLTAVWIQTCAVVLCFFLFISRPLGICGRACRQHRLYVVLVCKYPSSPKDLQPKSTKGELRELRPSESSSANRPKNELFSSQADACNFEVENPMQRTSTCSTLSSGRGPSQEEVPPPFEPGIPPPFDDVTELAKSKDNMTNVEYIGGTRIVTHTSSETASPTVISPSVQDFRGFSVDL